MQFVLCVWFFKRQKKTNEILCVNLNWVVIGIDFIQKKSFTYLLNERKKRERSNKEFCNNKVQQSQTHTETSEQSTDQSERLRSVRQETSRNATENNKTSLSSLCFVSFDFYITRSFCMCTTVTHTAYCTIVFCVDIISFPVGFAH